MHSTTTEIIRDDKHSWQTSLISDFSRKGGFGNTIISKTSVSGGIYIYRFEYEYNSDDYPTKETKTNSSNTFTYHTIYYEYY